MDQQRERCVQGKNLVSHFLDFNTYALAAMPNPLKSMFADARRLHEAAHVLQSLQSISQDLSVKGVDKVLVFSFSSVYLKRLLN